MSECNICYDDKECVDCFHNCSIKICEECIMKQFQFSFEGKIFYKCPQCSNRVTLWREDSLYCGKHSVDIDKKFDNFCIENKKIMKYITRIYEKEIKYEYDREFIPELIEITETRSTLRHDAPPFIPVSVRQI